MNIVQKGKRVRVRQRADMSVTMSLFNGIVWVLDGILEPFVTLFVWASWVLDIAIVTGLTIQATALLFGTMCAYFARWYWGRDPQHFRTYATAMEQFGGRPPKALGIYGVKVVFMAGVYLKMFRTGLITNLPIIVSGIAAIVVKVLAVIVWSWTVSAFTRTPRDPLTPAPQAVAEIVGTSPPAA